MNFLRQHDSITRNCSCSKHCALVAPKNTTKINQLPLHTFFVCIWVHEGIKKLKNTTQTYQSSSLLNLRVCYSARRSDLQGIVTSPTQTRVDLQCRALVILFPHSFTSCSICCVLDEQSCTFRWGFTLQKKGAGA